MGMKSRDGSCNFVGEHQGTGVGIEPFVVHAGSLKVLRFEMCSL